LRLFWEDDREGWQDKRVTHMDGKTSIRYPSVRRAKLRRLSPEQEAELLVMLRKSHLNQVDTELWELFGIQR
jgi:hypothetical protein